MKDNKLESNLFELLEKKAIQYNHRDFIITDPIAVPHQFSKKQDIEIAGFFAATLAWGLRKTIINNSNKLMELMDHAPYDFIKQHNEADLKPFLHFVHRTFNATDLLYFIYFLKEHYTKNDSLESAFVSTKFEQEPTIESHLNYFYDYFFSFEHPQRTHKHVASPRKNSACKRLCMYLRWMVRKDDNGVDFGIWNSIKMSQLICPLDVHVSHIANKLGLITSPKANWTIAQELTAALRILDTNDPSKYDYALFGLGVVEKGRF